MAALGLITGLVSALVLWVALELVFELELVLVLVLLPVSDGALEPFFGAASAIPADPFLSCSVCLSCFCFTAGQSKIEGSDSQPEKSITADKRKTGRNLLNQNSVPMANLVKIFFWSKSQPP